MLCDFYYNKLQLLLIKRGTPAGLHSYMNAWCLYNAYQCVRKLYAGAKCMTPLVAICLQGSCCEVLVRNSLAFCGNYINNP